MFTISGSSTATYNYDANGNVRYDTHRGIGYIIYDPNNLPVYAFLTNGQQLVYENDVNGSRVRNTISGTSDNFYFNGVEGKTEAVSTVAHGSNLIYNIPGAGGDNIGQVKVLSKATKRYYYLKDHLGSIKVTVDTTGTVVGYDDYYPYGMQMSGRSLVASEDGRYKFTGKELDSDEGLYYFGARYYDTWNARWLQVDPLAAKYSEYSPYNYTLNNPLNFIDPNGSASYYLDGVAVPQEFGQQMMGEYRNEELFGGEEKQNNNKQNDNNNQTISDNNQKHKLFTISAGVALAGTVGVNGSYGTVLDIASGNLSLFYTYGYSAGIEASVGVTFTYYPSASINDFIGVNTPYYANNPNWLNMQFGPLNLVTGNRNIRDFLDFQGYGYSIGPSFASGISLSNRSAIMPLFNIYTTFWDILRNLGKIHR